VEVDDIFYYVPIENTLKLVLQQLQSWSLTDRRGEQACSGVVIGCTVAVVCNCRIIV